MQTSTAERVQKHRAHLRASGLRPLQIWVPDTSKNDFAKECKRQSLLIANDSSEKDILDWLEEVADTEDWT